MEELAVRMKVPQSTIEGWIKGQGTMPDRKLSLLANILDEFSTKW